MCPISYCIGKYSSICLGSMYTSITYLKSNTVSSGSSPYKLKLDIWLVWLEPKLVSARLIMFEMCTQLVSARLADFENDLGSSGSRQQNFRLVPPL